MQEGDGTFLGLVVLDRSVDGARAAIDGDEQVAFAAVTIAGLQFWQVLDVDVDETEVVIAERALALGGLLGEGPLSTIEALGFENAPDAVAVEVRQEVADNEGEVVEREVGGAP